MSLSKPRCGAHASFCGKLKATKIATKPGEPRLDERADKDVQRVMGRKLKKSYQNLMLAGGGQSSFKLSDSSQMLFKRDYPILVEFDGRKKIGPIFVPSKIIPKYGFNLYRDKLSQAKVAAEDAVEQHPELALQDLAKKVLKAERSDVGDLPEENAFSAFQDAFQDALCSLILHSLTLFNPDLSSGTQEFDFFALDPETVTVFAVEVKKKLGNYVPQMDPNSPEKTTEEMKTVAQKVQEQLMKGKQFMEEWFGSDICAEWLFKPIIYTETIDEDIKPLCGECIDDTVAEGRDQFIAIVTKHRNTYKRGKIPMRIVQDFKVMARYMLFGIAAKSLPTSGRMAQEVSKYMEDTGSWDSVLLWCFLTPGQMDILSLPRVVFYSGWGGGKTITGLEVCKMWSKTCKVLILVNCFNTYGQTMPLVHNLRNQLKAFENIDVEQIDIGSQSSDQLQKLAHRHQALFLDEMPGDKETLVENKKFRKRMHALIQGKIKVWVALSNFDKDNFDTSDGVEIVKKVFKEDFTVVTSLNKNMRNPIHIKQQVGQSQRKRDDDGRTVENRTVAMLNNKMESPPNLLSGIKEDPQVVLRQVFIDKTMKAVIASRNSEDCLVIHLIMTRVLNCSNVIELTEWSDPEESYKQVSKWIKWNQHAKTPNILTTFRRILNGFDVEVVISIEDSKDQELGDIVSRATNLFINLQEVGKFLSEATYFPLKNGYFDFGKNIYSGDFLIQGIIEFFSIKNMMSKEDFLKTLHVPSKMFRSGLMEILFKAVVHLNCCIRLSNTEITSGEAKTISLCSGHLKDGQCLKTLHLECSVSKGFLLLMEKKDQDGHLRNLSSPRSPDWCLHRMKSLHHGYTIFPKSNSKHQIVMVNNGLTFAEAIKAVVKKDSPMIFLHDGHATFCQAMLQYFSLGTLTPQQLFDDDNKKQLYEYLETKIVEKQKPCLLFHFEGRKKNEDFYFKLPASWKNLITYFRLPLNKGGERKLLDIMEENPKLVEISFEGKGLIQDDPLNGVAMLNCILDDYGLKVRSKTIKFLEFGYQNPDCNFHSCLVALCQDFGLNIHEHDKEPLRTTFASHFWEPFRQEAMSFKSRMALVKKLFQHVGDALHCSFNMFALFDNRANLSSSHKFIALLDQRLNLSSSYSIKGKKSAIEIDLLYIFDEIDHYKNGFVVLDKKEDYKQSKTSRVMSKLLNKQF